MEGSSDTGWQKSSGFKGFENSASSERNLGNLRLLHASRLSLSTDASHNSTFATGRQVRDSFEPTSSEHVRNELKVDPLLDNIEWGDISMRRWLDNVERCVDVIESLHIFRQIVEIVNKAHSKGIVLNNVRPSCFIMSSFNHVSFFKSVACSDSGSYSLKDNSTFLACDLLDWKSRSDNKETKPYEMKDSGSSEKCGENPMKELLLMETSWYTTPEEIAGSPCSCASDIYRLGVLLFELFCTFTSPEDKSRTMSSLRHRVLPPQLLLKWPKEASFCLWLLHPHPSSRPMTR